MNSRKCVIDTFTVASQLNFRIRAHVRDTAVNVKSKLGKNFAFMAFAALSRVVKSCCSSVCDWLPVFYYVYSVFAIANHTRRLQMGIGELR